MFIDLILIAAAAVAIVGLATFVHLRGTQAPHKTANQSTIEAYNQHFDTLSLSGSPSDQTNTTTPGAPSDAAPAPQSTSKSQLQGEASVPNTSCASNSCNPGVSTNPIATTPLTTPITLPVTTPVSGPITVPPVVKPCADYRMRQSLTDNAPNLLCPL